MTKFKINSKTISDKNRTYFIADIAANHDGSLSRAKKLIKLAAENGADAAKFQNFQAERIVSRVGFNFGFGGRKKVGSKFSATGGNQAEATGYLSPNGYTYHVFTSPGTLTVSGTKQMDILLVILVVGLVNFICNLNIF